LEAQNASKQEESSSEEEDEDDNDKDKDKKALMKSDDTGDSEQKYSTYFKLVALKPKRAKIGIPTT
jgi:hypothetical protein